MGGPNLTEIIFSILLTIFQGDIDRELFETSGVVTPQGLVALAFITASPLPGQNTLFGAIQIQAGENLASNNFQTQELYTGEIFAISPNMIVTDDYIYLSAVCSSFNACIFRYNRNSNMWEGPVLVPTAAGLIVSTALSLYGGNLGLTMITTANQLLFLQANPAVAVLTLLTFAAIHPAILNVANTFDGGTIARTAVDPSNLRACHIYRQVATSILLGNVVATCFLNGISTTAILAVLSNSLGFVNYIESRALFHNGIFYFMYMLANGAVQLSSFANPALALQTITLGFVNLALGFPGLSMVIAGNNPALYAFWPGAAAVIALATFTHLPLNAFPINQVGPILALVLITAFTLSVGIWGSGSVVVTTMTEAVISAPPSVPVPFLDSWALALLAALLLIIGLALRRKPAGQAGPRG